MIELGGPTIGLREKVAALRQLSTGRLAQGARVAEFEEKFASWVHCENAIAVNSGTSALHIGLLALGIGPGDEVIVPSFSFAASANSIALTGATPVFCDVEPDYFTLDPIEAEKLINPNTKGIMVVHLYGQMADMVSLGNLANKFGLLLIEDAAQAHGAQLNGVAAGAWGDFGAFSFYPTKNMTTGEGGAITTARLDVDRGSRLLRNQGMIEKYQNEVVGLNNRLTEIQAAIGIEQLKRIDHLTRRRIRNASILTDHLSGVLGVKPPSIRPHSKHVFHQYTIQVQKNRDLLASQLEGLGVRTAVYYPTPIHKLPAYRSGAFLPVTENLAATCLSLPVHPSLSEATVKRIARKVREALGA